MLVILDWGIYNGIANIFFFSTPSYVFIIFRKKI